MTIESLKEQNKNLELRVSQLETKLDEFDKVVFASISQILISIGDGGSMSERVRNIEIALNTLATNIEMANDQIGDSRILDAINRTTQEIKTALRIN